MKQLAVYRAQNVDWEGNNNNDDELYSLLCITQGRQAAAGRMWKATSLRYFFLTSVMVKSTSSRATELWEAELSSDVEQDVRLTTLHLSYFYGTHGAVVEMEPAAWYQ